MWKLVAAELPAPVDNTSSYLVFAGVVVGAIASVLIAVIQTRKNRTEPSPPPPAESNGSGRLRERVAVNERDIAALIRAHDELEDAHDLLDRAHAKGQVCQDAIVRWLDREHPGWR